MISLTVKNSSSIVKYPKENFKGFWKCNSSAEDSATNDIKFSHLLMCMVYFLKISFFPFGLK